jgi:hypothetical protein
MLNVAQDVMWFVFAVLMMVAFSVPWYIALSPIALNLGIFFYGANVVRKSRKEIPRTSEPVIEYTNNVKEIDDMLYTISLQNPEEIQ